MASSGRVPLVDRHGFAAQPAVRNPSAKGRATRVAKFEREELIIDRLKHGVSVADIAAEIGIGEKRARAVIREALARRMPRPPEAFVAREVSRLNEAMLMAFSAMSPTNLKAVDQVVKIVRELDRYGGAFAAEWARPEAPWLEAPAEEDVAFAKAWLGDAELESEGGDDRPENPPQGLENIEYAPGFLQTPEARADAGAASDRRPAREAALRGPVAEGRPEMLLQGFEKIESAPGIPAIQMAQTPLAPFQPEGDRGEELRGLRVPARQTSHPGRLPLIPGSSPGSAKERPSARKIRRNALKRLNPRPGLGWPYQTAKAAAASPVSTPDRMLSLLRSAAGRQDLRACLSRPRPDTHDVAPHSDGGDFLFAAPAGRSPGNSAATP